MNFNRLAFQHITEFNDKIAIYDSSLNEYSYSDLFHAINEIANQFNSLGLEKNHLLILQTDKSFKSLAYLLCCIKLGVIYVPVDNNIPKDRLAYIIKTSDANAILTPDFTIELFNTTKTNKKDGFCVLFTSGSTGIPKGVECSKTAVLSFINWATKEFKISSKDLLTGFAPYHFDLSTFDLFSSLLNGATLWLIDNNLGKNFRQLSLHLEKLKPSIWYSTPTLYSLLNQYGKLPTEYSPKTVLFAGEVFPIKQLNNLRTSWPTANFYNLYGPTETNVCTYYKLPKTIELKRKHPYPIGVACPYSQISIDANGELLVSGKSLMLGYINDTDRTNEKLIVKNGTLWYKTGDLVKIEEDNLIYLGRIDRMIKRRGYRIELDEIELATASHKNVKSAAAVYLKIKELDQLIIFYIGTKTSNLALKTHSNDILLAYMIPDQYIHLDKMPINKNGKIDYKELITNFIGNDGL